MEKGITRLEELEMVVAGLPEKEYSAFRQWFLERDWGKWDQRIEENSRSGKLNGLIQEALETKKKGTLGNL